MATNVIGCLCHQVISNHGFGIVECSCRPRGKISTAYAISVLGKYTRTCFYFPSNILKKTVVRYCSFQSMKEITIMRTQRSHYSDVIMSSRASQFTGVSIACSTVCSGADQRKHQSSALLAFVRGFHRWPVNSPHKGPVTRTMFPFDDVIMIMRPSASLIVTYSVCTQVQGQIIISRGGICHIKVESCTWWQVFEIWHGDRYGYKVSKNHLKQVGVSPFWPDREQFNMVIQRFTMFLDLENPLFAVSFGVIAII